jgi:hypothetical protein
MHVSFPKGFALPPFFRFEKTGCCCTFLSSFRTSHTSPNSNSSRQSHPCGMVFELGFDPFNFIVAVLGLLITATHLMTNLRMHGQVGRPTATSCGLQATLPLSATSRHCRKQQNRLFMHFAMRRDSWYGLKGISR